MIMFAGPQSMELFGEGLGGIRDHVRKAYKELVCLIEHDWWS